MLLGVVSDVHCGHEWLRRALAQLGDRVDAVWCAGDIAYEYLATCARDGVIYVELTASIDHARISGMSDAEHFEGIAAGIDAARDEFGIEARILSVAVIHEFLSRHESQSINVKDVCQRIITQSRQVAVDPALQLAERLAATGGGAARLAEPSREP